MQFITDNFYILLFTLILWSMSPEVAIVMVIGLMYIGTPPLWVLIALAALASLINFGRINAKNKPNEQYFKFRFTNDNDDEGD